MKYLLIFLTLMAGCGSGETYEYESLRTMVIIDTHYPWAKNVTQRQRAQLRHDLQAYLQTACK